MIMIIFSLIQKLQPISCVDENFLPSVNLVEPGRRMILNGQNNNFKQNLCSPKQFSGFDIINITDNNCKDLLNHHKYEILYYD